MVKDTPSIPLDRLSGSKISVDDRSVKLVESNGSTPLMAMPCPWCAKVDSFAFLSLESLQMMILRGIQQYTSQDPMTGILQSWTLYTHLVMGSLLGTMTPLGGLRLSLT